MRTSGSLGAARLANGFLRGASADTVVFDLEERRPDVGRAPSASPVVASRETQRWRDKQTVAAPPRRHAAPWEDAYSSEWLTASRS